MLIFFNFRRQSACGSACSVLLSNDKKVPRIECSRSASIRHHVDCYFSRVLTILYRYRSTFSHQRTNLQCGRSIKTKPLQMMTCAASNKVSESDEICPVLCFLSFLSVLT